MVWKLREANVALQYDNNSECFTIRMYHSGKFVDLGRNCYVGVKISNLNYFESDEISMVELIEMAQELHLYDVEYFFRNRGPMNDCNDIYLMRDDNDALNPVNFFVERM